MHPLRERIQQPADLEHHEIWIPEWGHSVWVRGFTCLEREQWEASYRDGTKRFSVRAATAVAVCRDEGGTLIFEPSDIELLNHQSAAAVGRIFDLVIKLSNVTADDVDALEKN